MKGKKINVLPPPECGGGVIEGTVVSVGARTFRVKTARGLVTFDARYTNASGQYQGYGRTYWRFRGETPEQEPHR